MFEVLRPLDQSGYRGQRELGNLACWTVSSAKPGFEIDNVRDSSLQTFWQSDGPQPHEINVHFVRRVSLRTLAIHLDYTLDESYTPQKLSVRSGTCYHDLQEVMLLELQEPGGWLHFDLGSHGKHGILKTHLVQICVLVNHQNGKDTHIRAIKLYGDGFFDDSLGSSAAQIEDVPESTMRHLTARQDDWLSLR
ncbi:hypothetical protein PYCC9005_002616 [Savitreella phatthalungensis]